MGGEFLTSQAKVLRQARDYGNEAAVNTHQSVMKLYVPSLKRST
jgi:hypothetical protein